MEGEGVVRERQGPHEDGNVCVSQVLQLPQQTLLLQTHHAVRLLAGSARVCRRRRRKQQVAPQTQEVELRLVRFPLDQG